MSTPDAAFAPPAATCWRVFPWFEGASDGARFSPSWIPGPTGRGRFDLPGELSSVLYLARTPAHAVGEALQAWRGRPLLDGHLARVGLPLALVEVELPDGTTAALADLCDPAWLASSGIPPDTTAARDRRTTQAVARAAWDAGHAGVHWWSAFWGEWHTVVLFTARLEGAPAFGAPEALTVDHPAVHTAAGLLGMDV